MLRSEVPRAALRAPAIALIVVALVAGCGDGVGKTYPVSGTVFIGAAPLDAKSATVMFVPDRTKGNTSSFEPGATVDSTGHYTVFTKNQRGAPPGWYKVVVTGIAEAPPPESKGPLTKRPAPKSLVPAKYGRAATTPLEIEVVANPATGAYDLNLKP